MKLKRTGLILKSAALSVGILTASSGVAGQFDGVTLRVATWGGSWKENMAVSYTHLTLPTIYSV